MPITEVPNRPPPNAEQTPDPTPELPPQRNTSDYNDLGTDELVQRISELEDERRAARIREGIWVALLLHAVGVLLWIFGPRYIWHEPQVVTPKMKSSETLTYLPKMSRPKSSAPVHTSIDSKTLQRLRAAAPPTPLQEHPAPENAAQAQNQQAQNQQSQNQPPPPPTQQPSPVQPEPRQQAQVAPPQPAPVQPQQAPAPPASTQPKENPFQTPSSAGDMIRQAARRASGGGSSGAYAPAPRSAGGMGIPGPDILSDTMGYFLDPYLKRLIAATYASWIPIIPESARPPLSNRGKVFIDFTILPDGSVVKMVLHGPSGDVSLDRAAWGGITGAGYPPLPKDFKAPNLRLRFGFYYNIKPEDDQR